MKLKRRLNRTTLHLSNGRPRRIPIIHRNLFHPVLKSFGRYDDYGLSNRRPNRDQLEQEADRLLISAGEVDLVKLTEKTVSYSHPIAENYFDDEGDDDGYDPIAAEDSDEDGENTIELQLSEFDELTAVRARRGLHHFVDADCPNGCGGLDPDGSCDSCGHLESHPLDQFEIKGNITRTLAQLHATCR